MILADLIFACVLAGTSGQPISQTCHNTRLVPEITASIQASSKKYKVPAEIIAAVIYHESKFRKNARGDLGEAGLMQVKRGGAVQGRYMKMSFLQLCNVRTNIDIGTAYLAKVLPKCSHARKWLTRYNGGSCIPSRYSACVLSDLRRGRELSKLVSG